MLVAKIFAVVTGLLFIFKLLNTPGLITLPVIAVPGFVVFADLLMLILFACMVRKGDNA